MSGITYLSPIPTIPWEIFDSLQFNSLNGIVTQASLLNYLLLSGGTLTGGLNAINITMSGNLICSTGSQVQLLSTQASTSSSTGSLFSSGGCYFAKSSIFNGGITTSSIINTGDLTFNGTSNNILLQGSIAGTIFLNSTLVNTITFGANSSISGIYMNGSSDIITMVNTTSSTSSSTGAIQIAGGAYFGGNSIFNGNLAVNGILTTPNVSISGTTDSTSISTGCLTLLGGMGVAKSLYVGTTLNVANNINVSNGTLNLTHNGSNISFTNGSNSGLIELSNSPDLLRAVNGYAINISSGGISVGSASTLAARYPIDMGSSANDVQICLYQSGSNFLYGVGSNNSALELHTGGSVNFYNGTTGNGSLGVNILSISSGGNVTAANNVFATSYFATGFSSSGLSGPGLKMHYGNSTGQIFAYNYTTSTYIPMQVGELMQIGTNGGVNINSTNQTTSFPLSIYGSSSATRTSGNYAYLNSSSAANGGTANFTRNFALYLDSAGILIGAGEIDCFSDERLKDNIVELNDELCNRFINNIKPISFNYKKNLDKTKYGFSAQELIKNGFDALIGIVDGEENLEEQNIECINDNIFHLPSDMKLTVSVLDMIPILTKCIQNALKRIALLENALKRI